MGSARSPATGVGAAATGTGGALAQGAAPVQTLTIRGHDDNTVGSSDAAGGASRVNTNPQGAATLARVGTTGTISRGGLGSAGRGFASAGS